jgi:flagellar biosynthesis protein FlhF
MQVKTFTGKSTKDILARIKEELGPDAIILSNQKQTRKGVTRYEIMAALDVPPAADGARETPSSLGQDEASCLREEWTRLRKQLMAVLKPQMDIGLLTPRQQLVFEYLEREGVKEDVLLDLWEKFRRAPETPTLSVMNSMIGVAPWMNTSWEHKCHLLAGPFGSGKTSTALRLALSMKKARPKARILVANADRSQGKGRLYLRHYTELSGLSYRELDNSAHWETLRRDASGFDLVFVDLPGLPGQQELDGWLRGVSGGNLPPCHVHLVLSPLFGSAQMDSFVSRLRSAATASIIWTKLDEACNYGEIINQAKSTGLPVSLFSVGPDLKNTLVQPRDQDVWKLLLRHELPIATN